MWLTTGFRLFEFNSDFWLIVRVLSVRFLLVGKRLQVEVKRGFQSFSHHQLGGGGGGEGEGGFLSCSTCRNSFDNEYVGSNLVFPFNAHICHAVPCRMCSGGAARLPRRHFQQSTMSLFEGFSKHHPRRVQT